MKSHLFFVPLIAAALALNACGGASPSDESNATEDNLVGASADKDARMVRFIARVASDGKLEFTEADAIAKEALRGGLTKSVLKTAADFLANPPKELESRHDGITSADGGLGLIQSLYYATPRDFSGLEGSGQSVVESTSQTSREYFFNELPKEPIALRFEGTARESYTLSFTILEKAFAVDVPVGTTASGVATLVAQAIALSSQAVVDSQSNPNVISFDSDTYITGIGAQAEGNIVKISPALDS